MEALIILGLIVAAYHLGRLRQWFADVQRFTGTTPFNKKRRG